VVSVTTVISLFQRKKHQSQDLRKQSRLSSPQGVETLLEHVRVQDLAALGKKHFVAWNTTPCFLLEVS
jgi:hypothetical protein